MNSECEPGRIQRLYFSDMKQIKITLFPITINGRRVSDSLAAELVRYSSKVDFDGETATAFVAEYKLSLELLKVLR